MIEYYLKHNLKNSKANFIKLISEITSVLNIENLKIEETTETFYPELRNILNDSEYTELRNLFYTLNIHKSKIPFFNKYFKPKTEKSLKKHLFADLFAGCGGLSLGLEQAGFNCVFVNEIDNVFCETHYFNNNIPLSNYYVGDINELVTNFNEVGQNLLNLDLVCGGPPCQGFSVANRQKIIDDPRNNLYKAYLKFLQNTKPKFFVMENVKGMRSRIEEILTDFDYYLNKDYDISYSILNARDFGLPQNRERFFIIGNRIGIDTKQIFADIKQDAFKKEFILKDALKNLPQLMPNDIRNNSEIESDNIGYYIAKYQNQPTDYLNFINNNRVTNFVLNHKNRFNNKRDIEIFSKLPQGANSLHESITDIMPYSSRNNVFTDKYYKLDEMKVCKTITSHMRFDCNMYIHPNQSRGLSAREAARVQTFPDDFLFRGYPNNWYAQIGNAVPVKLAEIIGKHIIKHLKF